MAIEVKIPTILRTYTDGAKSVPGDGATLSALLDDLESRHTGLKGRLITDDGALHRFVNIYVNDEDVRFTGSLDTALKDGDSVTILPAVAGGCPTADVSDARRTDDAVRLACSTRSGEPRWWGCPGCRRAGRRRRAGGAAVGQAGGPQPDRLDQGPRGAGDDRGGRGGRPAHARLHDPRADVGQHRYLAGDGRQAQGLRHGLRDAGEHLRGAAAAAGDVRRADHLLAGGRWLEPGRRDGQATRRGEPRLGDALPVRQPGQRPGALRRHRPRDPRRPADASRTSSPAWAPPAR